MQARDRRPSFALEVAIAGAGADQLRSVVDELVDVDLPVGVAGDERVGGREAHPSVVGHEPAALARLDVIAGAVRPLRRGDRRE